MSRASKWDDFDHTRYERDDTGQDEPVDYRTYSEIQQSDRNEYASEMVEKGEWDPIQADEFRRGA